MGISLVGVQSLIGTCIPLVAAFIVGRGVVAGAATCGLGALAYYGLGMSSQAGALEQSLYVQFLYSIMIC